MIVRDKKLGVVVHNETLVMLVPIFAKKIFGGQPYPRTFPKKKSSKLKFGLLDLIEGVFSHINYPKNQICPSRNFPKMATEVGKSSFWTLFQTALTAEPIEIQKREKHFLIYN